MERGRELVFSAVVDSPNAAVAVFDITEAVVSQVSAASFRLCVDVSGSSGRRSVEYSSFTVEFSCRRAGARTVASNIVGGALLGAAVPDYHRQKECQG